MLMSFQHTLPSVTSLFRPGVLNLGGQLVRVMTFRGHGSCAAIRKSNGLIFGKRIAFLCKNRDHRGAHSFHSGFVPTYKSNRTLEWSSLDKRAGEHIVNMKYSESVTKPLNEHHDTQSALRMEIIIVRATYTTSRTSLGENPKVLFFLTFTFVDFRAACVAKADAVMRIRESFPPRVVVSAHVERTG